MQEGLDAIAHRGRRAMLTLLLGGERSAGELAAHAGMRQPVASQHLRVLREAGLVTVRKDGNRRVYSVDLENLARLRSELDAFWKPALGALKDTAEAAARAAGEPTALDAAGWSRTRPSQARRGGGGG